MATPQRIQRSRVKGWRMPADTIYVGRPSAWGNQYEAMRAGGQWSVFRRVQLKEGLLHYWLERVGLVSREEAIAEAIRCYRASILAWVEDEWDGRLDAALSDLRGKTLACWCPLDRACHADVLLDLANREVAA